MPRKSRRDQAGAAHHAFPRGNGRQDIFHDDADRQVLLVILAGVVKAYGWHVHAYCLMRNHMHLVVQTPLPNFGAGMQRLLGTYASYLNRRHEMSGHRFKRPFKSEPIKDERQLAAAIAYTAANPIRAGLCSEEAEWRWSSHGSGPCPHRPHVMAATH